ncbi:MAG: ATP-binding cassette domain-containing protein [Treponema sp.]
MSLFEMKNVTFTSRKFEVVDHVSLMIAKGSVTEFHGPSGGGKSTLLKMLAGIIIPVEGNVFYKSKDINLMSRQEDLVFRKECAFVFQDSALWANQTIIQNILLPVQIHYPKITKEKQIEKVKKICDIVCYNKDMNLRPADLSAGEQKKIAFARALVCEPSVLFLDECTASLDDNASNNFIRILHEFMKEGNTIIYISHSEKFRWEFSGNLYEVKNGNVELQSIDIDDLR